MKTISVLIPTYNEEENVVPMAAAVKNMFETALPGYAWEIVFIDNFSKDRTRERLRELCANDKRVKCIFNAKNFGQFNSPFYGLCQTTGDCAVLLCADFQDPVEMIPRFVEGWENGYKIVAGIKKSSRENKLMYFLRSVYYKLIKKMSDVEQIEHFTGFGLYDKSFIDVLRSLDDPAPFLRGLSPSSASTPGYRICPAETARGKSSNNFYRLYDAAMLSFTSYTKIGMRLATILGFFPIASGLIAFVYLILKLLFGTVSPWARCRF